MTATIHKGKALVLRTCKADMTARGGFVWPESGPVEALDWEPTPECGNGLHGALWGEGNGVLFNWDDDAVWQVVEIFEWIDLGGKVKFPRGVVRHTGDQKSATDYIIANGARGAVIGATVSGGYRATVSGGYMATVSGGYMAILSIKYYDGNRYRLAVGYVGEDGINPNTPYRVNDKGEFVEVKQ